MRRIPLGLVLAIVIYVALRALILVTRFEAVSIPMYELYPMGTMAELRLRGVEFPLRYFYDNAAGQILMGFLTVPVFALFGSSYLALKILPATLGLLALVVLWKFLDRFASRRAANVGALLFAVAPPLVTKYSVINSGNHFENLLFTLVALWFAYRWLASDAKTKSALCAAGFSAGFALFVFLGALIPVGVLVGMHVGLRGLRRWLRDLVVWLPAFLLGAAPLVIVNAVTSERGLGFLGAKFASSSSGRGGQVFSRAADFLGPSLVRAGVYEPFAGLSRTALAVLFLTAFAIAYLACVPSTLASLGAFARGLLAREHDVTSDRAAFERAKLVPFVLYLPLAALAYGISNFRLGGHAPPVEVAGYRYYLPTFLFGLIAISVWVDRWMSAGGAKRAFGTAVFVAALVPGLSSLAIVDPHCAEPNVGAKLDGYNLAQLARGLVSSRNALSDQQIVAHVESLPADFRFDVQTAIGFNLGVAFLEHADLELSRIRGKPSLADSHDLDVRQLLDRFPTSWNVALCRGIGTATRWRGDHAQQPAARSMQQAGRLDPARYEHDFDMRTPIPGTQLASAGELTVGSATWNVALLPPWSDRDVLEATHAALTGPSPDSLVGQELREGLYGHGVVCGRLWARGVESDLTWVETHMPSDGDETHGGTTYLGAGPAFARGFGEGLARDHRESWRLDRILVRSLDPTVRNALCEGIGRGLWIRTGGAALDEAELTQRLAADDIAAVRTGWLATQRAPDDPFSSRHD